MAANMKRDTFPASLNAGSPEYRIYSDFSEIASISPRWDDLLEGSSCNRAFGSLEWYLASCRIQTSLKPYLLTAALGPQLISVLPLAIDPRTGIGQFPHLENDYNDALVRGSDPVAVAGLLQYALFEGAPCRQLRLSKLKPHSLCAQAAAVFSSSSLIACRSRDMKLYRFIKLPPTFDEYLASRGKLFRRNIRRALRRGNEDGLMIRQVHPDDLSPSDLPEVFLQLILDRHRTNCAFRHPHTQSLVREVLPPLFSKGSLQAFAIVRKEQIVALDLYLSDSHGLVAWNGGFLAQIERWSPGSTLIACAVKQAIAMGLDELDFGEGDETYKQLWSNSSYITRELDIIKT